MNTISAIRSAVDSAVVAGPVTDSVAIRRSLESQGFRFFAGRDGGTDNRLMLWVRHDARYNGMPTPADMRIVRQHSAAIRFSFAG